MSNTVSTDTLAEKIYNALLELQNIAIGRRNSGRTEEQSIVPSVTIDYQELRRLSKRQRIKESFIDNLTEALEGWGLEVDVAPDLAAIEITKPADDIEVEHDSFKSLTDELKLAWEDVQ